MKKRIYIAVGANHTSIDLELDDPAFTTNEPLRIGTRLCRGAVIPTNLNHLRVKPGRAFGLRVAGVAKQWVGDGRKLSAAFTFAPCSMPKAQ